MTRVNLYGDGLVRLSRKLGLVVGMLLCSNVVTVTAMAETIRYDFTGNVLTVDQILQSQFTPRSSTSSGSTMSGSMTVNTTDTNLNLTRGNYLLESFRVTFSSGYSVTLGPSFSGSVEIRNELLDGFGTHVSQISGPTVNALPPHFFDIGLFGPSTLWNSDALPRPVPSLSLFVTVVPGFNNFRLTFVGGQTVKGTLTSLTAVPLPASVVLFGVGLVALAGLGAGTLRNYLRSPA